MMSEKHLTLNEINAHFNPKGFEFDSMTEDKTGFINKTIFLHEKHGKEYVLRLCSTKEQFKEAKTLNEVNVFGKIAEISGIPAPTVFDFDSTMDNPFACEYILMDRLPGVPLGKVIDKMPRTEVVQIMEELVEMFKGPWALRFDAIGTLDKKMVPGPILSMNKKGPFSNQADMSEAFLEMVVEMQPEPFATNLESIYKLRKEILTKSLKPPVFICFGHDDLNFDNILVENGHITGVVDWEWSGSASFESEIFNCDFYRSVEYREAFLDILDNKMGFNVRKAMLDAYDLNAFILGVLVYGWHPMWGLTSDDPFVQRWVSELKKLAEKYGVDCGELQ